MLVNDGYAIDDVLGRRGERHAEQRRLAAARRGRGMRTSTDRLRGRALPDRVVEAQVIRHVLHGRLAAAIASSLSSCAGNLGAGRITVQVVRVKDRGPLLRRADRRSSRDLVSKCL